MNPEYANRIADHLVGNGDISQEEARTFVAKELAPLITDSETLSWLSDHHAEFFQSKWSVVAQYDGLRVAVLKARGLIA